MPCSPYTSCSVSAAATNAGLILGIGTGLVFGLAQQALGAHYVSHDWTVALTLYILVFNARLWKQPATSLEQEHAGASAYETSPSAHPLVAGRHVDVELRTRRL